MMVKRVGLILQSACGGRLVAPLRAMLRFLWLLPYLGWNIGAIRVEFLTDQLRLDVFFLGWVHTCNVTACRNTVS